MPLPIATAVDAVSRLFKAEPLMIVSALVSALVSVAGVLHIGLDHVTVENVVTPLILGGIGRLHVNSKYVTEEQTAVKVAEDLGRAASDADPKVFNQVEDTVTDAVQQYAHHQLTLDDLQAFATPIV